MDLSGTYAEYEPSLLLGIGGTGVRVLRLILARGKSGEDPGLKTAINEGRLQMLAIDTDAGSNSRTGSADNPAVDDFLLIDSREIWRAIRGMLHGQFREGVVEIADDHRAAYHDAVRQFMPALSPHAKLSLSPGQADEQGARQNRLLGRVALFSAAGDVYQRIGEKLSDARRHRQANERLRVYIICSLAGGTGCGMMFDVALLTRMQEESANLFATLLLPGAFGDPNRNGETYVNTYAALKELSVVKNWQLPSDEFAVTYPEELGRNRVYKVDHGAPSLFRQIFLYDDLDSASAEDISEANRSERIDGACRRLSSNVLAQLRTDVRGIIDIGMNNENGDAAQLRGDPRARYAFSTSATATFPILSIDDMARTIVGFRAHSIARSLTPESRELSQQELAESWSIPQDSDGHKEPFTHLHNALLEGMPADLELEIRWVENQETAVEALKRSLRGRDMITGEEFLQIADEAGISANARRAIRQKIVSAVADWSKLTGDASHAQLSPVEFYGARIDAEIDLFVETFNDFVEKLNDENNLISKRRLRDWRDDLSKVLPQIETKQDGKSRAVESRSRTPPAALMIPIDVPPSLVKMRHYLGWIATEGDVELQSVAGPQPERILKLLADVFCNEYGRSIKAVDAHFRQYQDTIEYWQEVVEIRLLRNSKKLAKCLEKLEKLCDAQRDMLDNLATRTNSRAIEAQSARDYERMLSRTEKSLEPMGEEVRKLLAQSEFVPQATVSPLARLTHALNSVATSPGAEEPSISETDVRDALAAVRTDLDDKSDQVEHPVCKALCEALDSFVSERDRFTSEQMLNEPTSFLEGEVKRRSGLYTRLAGQLLLYFVRQQPFFIARLGGEDGVRNALKSCASSVFVGNRIERSIQRKSLIICRPNVDAARHDDRDGRQTRGDHHSLIRRMAQEILRDTGDYPSERTDMPLVYFEQRYHGALEISRIDTYYRAYTETPEAERKLYHLFPEANEYPELVDRRIPEEILRPTHWRCKFTEHGCVHIPLSHALCPACVEEYIAHRRPLKKVSRQDPYSELVVPEYSEPDRVAFRIPGNMIEPYFWHGVPVGDEDAFKAEFNRRNLMGAFN